MTPGSPVLAIVKDLFFVARIRETARLAGVPLTFARTPEEITTGLAACARQTQPWHARCERVVTKETLTAELPSLLRGSAR